MRRTNPRNLNWKRIQGGSNNGSDFTVKRYTKFKEGDPFIWGKATATIHASSRQTLAWLWHYCSNHRMKIHQKKDGNLIRQVYEPLKTSPSSTSFEEQVSTNKSGERSDELCEGYPSQRSEC